MQAQQYFAEANEAESWMREKEPVVGNTDYGKDEDSAEALLKKHEALMSDIETYKTLIDNLREQANSCKVTISVLLPFVGFVKNVWGSFVVFKA